MNKNRPVFRMCIVSRDRDLKENLFRFVKQNNEIILDLNQNIQGRGVYIKKDLRVIELAQKRKMLEISDNIIKMNFKSSKEFGKEIGREYWKKSDGSKKTMPLEMKKRIEQNEKAIRQKINLKHNIVKKLKFNLIHESHVLHHLMEETIK